MTREEAIDVLKHNYPSACFTDLCEAVEIAIQALSVQPEIIRCKDCCWGREACGNIECLLNDTSFMADHSRKGQEDAKLYSHDFGERAYDDDKIMKIICRVIKAVMDYEWGEDGV